MIELIKAVIINLAVIAVWYHCEYSQFKELQWDRKCDAVVATIYFMIIWFLLLQLRK